MEKRAVVSVVGKDQVGIIAKVTTIISDNDVNILDISQTILEGFFTMIMLIEIKDPSSLETLQKKFQPLEQELGLKINIQLEDVFQAMHRV
ncbi:ACT domain-containing protein [Gracilibacillus sp. S3-1-1]|uniref:ACT domain-containing protein n=1 Tax=Gracilibacillus pellucidus TaxID=3095368 RepID=A0ACC6M7E6_9BACI|nr:ACT domain-containing protein [Gracilibacillus sp. S3-1-1]MDX8046879.1 ACT domain-containing protein [Gracilibacillus sp. S3-1-1]